MSQALTATGLTTGQAPFVEEARHRGDLYIEQAYELYSEENHEHGGSSIAGSARVGSDMPTRLFSRASRRWRFHPIACLVFARSTRSYAR